MPSPDQKTKKSTAEVPPLHRNPIPTNNSATQKTLPCDMLHRYGGWPAVLSWRGTDKSILLKNVRPTTSSIIQFHAHRTVQRGVGVHEYQCLRCCKGIRVCLSKNQPSLMTPTCPRLMNRYQSIAHAIGIEQRRNLPLLDRQVMKK